MPRLLRLLAGTVLLAAPAPAQSVAGEWDVQINTPGGIRNSKAIFQVSGDTLTGVVQRATDTLPLTGTITADTVRYTYTINYEGNPLELTVTARLSGDTMEGTVSFGGLAEGAFSARRARRPPF
jgi:hypothetical protein